MAETKVILTKSVNHLGHPGDVVSVKAGYARNYLIPQGLGFAWSKNAAAQIEAMKRARLAKAVATREEAVAAKELIEGSVVEIAAKVTEIDYKDVALLRKFISDRGKIRSRRITGVTVQEQREISKAIKNAREMALLPYATSGR